MKNNVYINGVKIFSFENRENLLDFIENQKKILIAINSEKIIKDNVKLKEIISRNIGYPDGIGAVMALRQKGFDAVRIPGAELWLDIVNRFQKEKSFYLLGSSKDVIDKTVSKLKKEYPDINIVGYRDGYLKESDKDILIQELNYKKPDVIFIAQGSPRQEILMNELIKEHPALYMGLGGSFDVYTGFKKRAPQFFCKLNLEWLYRLVKEPSRAGRQTALLKFLYLYTMNKL